MLYCLFVMWLYKVLWIFVELVIEIIDDIWVIWDEMVMVMDEMLGVGFVVVQLGILLCLVVVDVFEVCGQVVLMVNFEVVYVSVQLCDYEEVSLNLLGVLVKIICFWVVIVWFLNQSGEMEECDFVGFWVISVQYQIDYLNGKMYFDNLFKVKWDMLVCKVKKLRG